MNNRMTEKLVKLFAVLVLFLSGCQAGSEGNTAAVKPQASGDSGTNETTVPEKYNADENRIRQINAPE